MLDHAEHGKSLSARAYDTAERTLRTRLLAAQLALRATRRQVIVVVSGADGAGKGELVHRFNEWLDPRGVATHAFWDASDEEDERPHFYRFWRAMPGAGRVGIFFGSWYTRPIIDRVTRARRKKEFVPELDRIRAFERMLTDGGVTLVKLWLHLSKDAQRERLQELEKDGRLGPDDWDHFRAYDRFREVSERALVHTNEPWARWHAIDATDRRWREIACGRLLLEAVEAAGAAAPVRSARPAKRADIPGPARLDAVDLTQTLAARAYEKELDRLSERLSRLAWAARERKVATVLAFEGWDAAGKGSAIRRVTGALDPRLYRVVGIAAPTDEERAQHYLWRFWRHLPRDGRITIFDRSWYGRVLVERVEGFAPPADWDRAYDEINDFERQLTDHGMAVAKFWIHISPDEQLRRFRERQRVAYKRHKITDEDWRNRKQLGAYRLAVEEMLQRCDTPDAPWTVVAGNDKRHARIEILRAVADRMSRAVEGE